MHPIVAIVGRPNVGKSTLFNRIVGGHRAITLDEPGVTRDRHYGHAQWDAREFVLIDTGGLFLDEAEGIEAKVRQQVETAIHEASVILFLMDGQSGLIPGEREIADRLRRSGKPVLFLVNKIDDPKHQERVSEFYQLGSEVYPVSAEHGTWVNDLLDRVIEKLPPRETLEKSEKKKAIRIAMIGRPNVGKSSLLNRILGEERLIVHNEPGTTRDSIDTHIQRGDQDYILIDTAGIRRKGKWASKVERYSVLNALKSVERADICVMVLDAAEGIHKQDAHVAGYAAEAKKGILLLWNKWDLIQLKESKKEKEFLRMVRDQLKFLAYAPVRFVSAKTGERCEEIWDEVGSLYHACGKRVTTSDVNRAFEGLIESHNPPVYKGKPVKFFYATQTQVYPPTFVIFVNEPEGVHFSFKRYLQNGFRKAFEFDGAPLEIIFRRKRS